MSSSTDSQPEEPDWDKHMPKVDYCDQQVETDCGCKLTLWRKKGPEVTRACARHVWWTHRGVYLLYVEEQRRKKAEYQSFMRSIDPELGPRKLPHIDDSPNEKDKGQDEEG